MAHRVAAACAALALTAVSAPTAFGQAAPAWDNLVRVETRRLDQVMLLPGADFRPYTKVMLDPTEVAFTRNFQRDVNRGTRSPSARVTNADMTRMTNEVQAGFGQVFTEVFQAAGMPVVTTPGPDVLRLKTAVANLFISAPDMRTPGRSQTFTREAGQATLVLEARDSETGELLGRAIDRRTTGDMGPFLRNSVTNRADFARMFRTWATTSVNGLAELRALSPVQAPTAAASAP